MWPSRRTNRASPTLQRPWQHNGGDEFEVSSSETTHIIWFIHKMLDEKAATR